MSRIIEFYNEKIRLPSLKREINRQRRFIKGLDKIELSEFAEKERFKLSNLYQKIYKLGIEDAN